MQESVTTDLLTNKSNNTQSITLFERSKVEFSIRKFDSSYTFSSHTNTYRFIVHIAIKPDILLNKVHFTLCLNSLYALKLNWTTI